MLHSHLHFSSEKICQIPANNVLFLVCVAMINKGLLQYLHLNMTIVALVQLSWQSKEWNFRFLPKVIGGEKGAKSSSLPYAYAIDHSSAKVLLRLK